jgi:membrane associated rhomboid family serine protease
MIIPLGHENLRGRRWPWITIAIIAINVVVFLFTNGTLEKQEAQTAEVELHILLLSARFNDAPMTPEAAEFVASFKRQEPRTYEEMASPSRTEAVDAWDANLQEKEWTPDEANAEMARLCSQLTEVRDNSIAWKYAFHSMHPFLKTYITASFLHGGWLHIIFNMWFLWLAGTVLEDAWGRIVYPIFYLATGVLAFAVHGAVFPNSFVACVGASGAIAGLMGAFLARFPKTRIRLGWWLVVYLVRFYVPAYVILPLWLVVQVFWGVLSRASGAGGGIAYWAHIGGFAFGALGAWILSITGIEHSANQAIEAKVTWTADPHIVRASVSLGENNAEGAVAALHDLVKQQPDSLEGWELLFRAQQKKQDVEGQKEALAALCRLHVTSGELELAWDECKELRLLGGGKMPRGVWLELCKYLEREQHWDTAVSEYEGLAQANPGERASVSALMAAARISLDHLRNTDRAEVLFKAAAASPAPHSDFDAAIQDGLKRCATIAPKSGAYGR